MEHQRLYTTLTPVYEQRWRGYLNSTHAHALRLLQPQKKDRVLDLSGGTGVFSELIEGRCKVTLVDDTAAMLNRARAQLRKTEIIKADAHKLPFKKSFTKIVCLNALHYYRDPQQVFTECHRVLRKGGEIIVLDWCRDSWRIQIYDWWLRLTKQAHEKAYTTRELYELLQEAGFRVELTVRWRYHLWYLMAVRARKS